MPAHARKRPPRTPPDSMTSLRGNGTSSLRTGQDVFVARGSTRPRDSSRLPPRHFTAPPSMLILIYKYGYDTSYIRCSHLSSLPIEQALGHARSSRALGDRAPRCRPVPPRNRRQRSRCTCTPKILLDHSPCSSKSPERSRHRFRGASMTPAAFVPPLSGRFDDLRCLRSSAFGALR